MKPAWYHKRQRSITPGQKAAERALWPLFGLTFAFDQKLDLGAAFKRSNAPCILEVGCGAGEALVELAEARPEANFLGVDWYRSGLASCCMELEARGLSNVRLVKADAYTMLSQGLPAAPLFDEARFFFPDPWHGSPERRILRSEVVQALGRRMRPSGVLHFASDVAGYPDEVRTLLATPATTGSRWRALPSAGLWRPSTKYEREAIAAGRAIEDLYFEFEGICECDSDTARRPAA